MKFIGQPNLLVNFKPPIGRTNKIQFDNNGFFVTDDNNIIKRMSIHFKAEDISYKCKYCNESFDKKGNLLVHYRKHKEDK